MLKDVVQVSKIVWEPVRPAGMCRSTKASPIGRDNTPARDQRINDELKRGPGIRPAMQINEKRCIVITPLIQAVLDASNHQRPRSPGHCSLVNLAITHPEFFPLLKPHS